MNAHAREGWGDAWKRSLSDRDPYAFATGVLGFLPADASNPDGHHQLSEWQDQFLRDFNTSPRHSVRSGHGVGKGTTIAILALWFVSTFYDAKAVLTANSQDQLRDNNWPEIKKWHRQLPIALQEQIEIAEERMHVKVMPEMSFLVRRTASRDRPEALQGIHAKHVLYIVDEASGIPDITFEVAQGSLSTEGAMAVLFSNPTRSNGFFYKTHNELRGLWKCWHVNAETVPRAAASVKEFAQTYGRDSNKYRVRVLGEFPSHDDETVIPLASVLGAVGRDVATSSVWPVWGLDVARFGDDRSALVKRQGNTLLGPPIVWKNKSAVQLAALVEQEYMATPNHEKPKEIWVDVIGNGSGVCDILSSPGREPRMAMRACNVSEAPMTSNIDMRLRDELWFKAREWFASNNVKFPLYGADAPHKDVMIQELISELTTPMFDFTASGKRVVESKDEFKKRLGRSSDLADAFIMTMGAGIYHREDPHRGVYRTRRATQTSWMAA